jgi:hypothetical protein
MYQFKKGKRMKLVYLTVLLSLNTMLIGCALTPPPPPLPDDNAVIRAINPEHLTENQIKIVRDEYRLTPVVNHLEGLEQ